MLFDVMEILSEANIQAAIRHMIRKHTGCGCDGMHASELPAWWVENGATTRMKIMQGEYVPRMALQFQIPKADGSMRILEIPSVVDRMLQFAICNILQPVYEKRFSEHSHGFRNGRGCKSAIRECLRIMNEGYVYAADLDIRSYFDNVSHSLLLDSLRVDTGEGVLLKLIESYLKIRVCRGNHVYRKCRGICQGGPLSPLLANITLDGLDHYLEGSGYRHVRYADDIVIFCRSEEGAGDALMDAAGYLAAMLKLHLNREKTGIVHVDQLSYLGYSFALNEAGEAEAYVSTRALCHMQSGMDKHMNAVKENTMEWWDTLGAYNRGWLSHYSLVREDVLENIASFMDEREMDGITAILQKKGQLYEEALLRSRGYVSPLEWYAEMQRRIEDGSWKD